MKIISVLIGIVIIYIVQAFLFRKYWDKKLEVSAEFKEKAINEGQSVTIEEIIVNRKWLPLPLVTMKFILSSAFKEKNSDKKIVSDYYNRSEIFSLLMFQKIKRKIEFVCTKRGIYKIQALTIQVGNLFLNETNIKEVESNGKLVVYPGFVNVNQFLDIFQNVYGDIITKQFMTEDPFLNRGVREYQIYDRMKLINWSASAKTGELKVNILENTSKRDVVIFLNLQRDTMLLGSDITEEAIRLTKTFANELYKQGIKSIIYTNGNDIETDETVQIEDINSNKNYMDIVNNALARIVVKEGGNVHTEYEANNFMEMYKNKIEKLQEDKYLIFISNYQREDFQNALIDIKNKNADFKWIVPVSNRRDFHVGSNLIKKTVIWRMNWEGVYGGGKFD